jgi:hypothetical protein
MSNFRQKFHDPLEMFQDPLLGRDPPVEKHWPRGFSNSGLALRSFVGRNERKKVTLSVNGQKDIRLDKVHKSKGRTLFVVYV